MHDSINFDIDLNLTNEELKTFSNIPYKEYIYVDSDDVDTINPEFSEIKIGKIHKCRLHGLTKNQNYSSDKMIYSQVGLLINESDGFVKVSIIDIDFYNRILIDLEFITPRKNVNLKDFILNNSRVYNRHNPRQSIKLQPAGSISYNNYIKSINCK